MGIRGVRVRAAAHSRLLRRLAACGAALLIGCSAPVKSPRLVQAPTQWPPVPLAQPVPGWPSERLPYFWPYPEVPPPKWPEPHPEARPERGMSPVKYFDKLCALESGTFISRTVADVDGYYLIRPRIAMGSEYGGATVTNLLLADLYAVEDPFGWYDKQGELARVPTSGVVRRSERGYDFVEVPDVDVAALPAARFYFNERKPQRPYLRQPVTIADPPVRQGELPPWHGADILIRRGGEGPYLRYERADDPIVDVHHRNYILAHWKGARDLSDYPTPMDYLKYPSIETRVTTLRSRYGLVWRGISRPFDRDMGIAGSELIVLDLHTNEVLGVRRGFALAVPDPTGKRYTWFGALRCPSELSEPLVKRVLRVRGYVPPKIQLP